MDQVDKDIIAKDAEIQTTAKAFKDMTADSTGTAFSALETVLADAGHELSEATRAKMKAALVGKEDLPEDPFLARFNGPAEFFPRELPGIYGPARTDRTASGPTLSKGLGLRARQVPTRNPSRGARARGLLPALWPILGLRPPGSWCKGLWSPLTFSGTPLQF